MRLAWRSARFGGSRSAKGQVHVAPGGLGAIGGFRRNECGATGEAVRKWGTAGGGRFVDGKLAEGRGSSDRVPRDGEKCGWRRDHAEQLTLMYVAAGSESNRH